jgi:hypothetical protein
MLPLSPGNSPVFQLTPEPLGVPTSIDNIGWAAESSDGSSVTMTANSDDLTGMTATLSIPQDATVGAIITAWAVYRNPSGSEIMAGPYNWTIT